MQILLFPEPRRQKLKLGLARWVPLTTAPDVRNANRVRFRTKLEVRRARNVLQARSRLPRVSSLASSVKNVQRIHSANLAPESVLNVHPEMCGTLARSAYAAHQELAWSDVDARDALPITLPLRRIKNFVRNVRRVCAQIGTALAVRRAGVLRDFSMTEGCIACNIEETEYRTFKNETTGTCEPCPPRTTILDFSKPTVKCEKCPPGMFLTDIIVPMDFRVPICEKCPPGSTTRGFGKPLCREDEKPCPDNTFEDEDGDCQACDAHFRFDPANKKCVECKRNEVLHGYPNSAHIRTKCRKCGRGQIRYLGRYVCPDGHTFRKGRCKRCRAGTSSILGKDCRPCDSA